MAKNLTIRPPRPGKWWFIVEPSGTILGYTASSRKRDCIREYLANIWEIESRWPKYQAGGFRCIKCDVTPAQP